MNEILLLLSILFFSICVSSVPITSEENGAPKCGYQACHPTKDGHINIHLVPHSHDDVGWLKTVEQYYYGLNNDIYVAGVQFIYDTTVASLRKNKDRKFIYVETAFFWKWWQHQDENTKNDVREMVNNGQIEFVGGGWSMNDEAVTTYQSVIDQMTWGLRRLNDTFGACAVPKMGWQIDPFGHSSEMASIFAGLGFDGVLLGRLDYQDRARRMMHNTMEMVWRGSDSIALIAKQQQKHVEFDYPRWKIASGTKMNTRDVRYIDPGASGRGLSAVCHVDFYRAASDIFAGILFRHYDAPSHFNFGGGDDPLVDDPNSKEFNIEEKVKQFIKEYVTPAHGVYTTSNILVTMGSDFAYQNAELWYYSMDKLIKEAIPRLVASTTYGYHNCGYVYFQFVSNLNYIKYMNSREFKGVNYNVIYSTPSCYLHAVYKETQGKLSGPVKTDDFFPYGSDEHSYWTGYFTSRPTLKRFERIGNSFLQSCKQLAALTNLTSEVDTENLTALREAMGVMQHHDAVTGTEKEVVAYNYAELLHDGIKKCEKVASNALSTLTLNNQPFKQCLLTNISQCDVSEKEDTFVVTVQNLLSRPIDKYVRLPVFGSNFSVHDNLGEKVPWQLVPLAEQLITYPGRNNSSSTRELVFESKDIPALGFKSYYVKRLNRTDNSIFAEEVNTNKSGVVEVKTHGQNLTLFINIKRGTLEKLTMNGIHLELHQNFLYYNGSNGMDNNIIMEINRPSGAYIFRPDVSYPIRTLKERVTFKIYKGDLVTEIHQNFTSWISQVIKIYKNKNYVEFNWLVGPMESSGSNGKEVITRFTTNLKTDSTFYTDSNSRGLLKRVRNYRPTWTFTTNESISANYYPVTSEIGFKDEEKDIGLVLITDRSQGGSSLRDGMLELMLHRYTVMDDSLGVDESLSEIAYGQGLVARGQIFLTVGRTKNSSEDDCTLLKDGRELKELGLMEAQIYLSVPEEKNFEEYHKKYSMKFGGLTKALPRNVHIMTLEPWKPSSYLLRLEHLYEKNEDLELSKPALVDLKDLFTTLDVVSVKETTLGANQWLEENKRLLFKSTEEHENKDKSHKEIKEDEEFKIQLSPQQIRTFIIDVENK